MNITTKTNGNMSHNYFGCTTKQKTDLKKMANAKNHYYVLVLTNTGAKFVTGIDRINKNAMWDENGIPLEMSKNTAVDMAIGLTLNFNNAFMVCVPYKLESQPYRYNVGHFEWVENDK